MKIGGLQSFTTIDFPSVLSVAVFTAGCNLNCFYCHNRGLIKGEALITEEEALKFLEERKLLLEGVVISGGEPTLQKDLAEFIFKVKSLGYKIKLDTNGSFPEVLEGLLALNILDYVAIDIKTKPKEYKKVFNVDFSVIEKSLELLYKSNIEFEGRTTLYPGMDIKLLKETLKSVKPLKTYRLNFFKFPEEYLKEDFSLLNKKALEKKDIAANEEMLKEIQPNLIF